jgi:hypothetical protein
MEDFTRDFVSEHIHVLSADEVLNRYSPEKRLEGLSPDEVLNRYSPDEVLNRYPPEKRLEGLSPEILRAFLEQLESQKKSKE